MTPKIKIDKQNNECIIGERNFESLVCVTKWGSTHLSLSVMDDWELDCFENIYWKDLLVDMEMSLHVKYPEENSNTHIRILNEHLENKETKIEYIRLFNYRGWKAPWDLERFARKYRRLINNKNWKGVIASEYTNEPSTPYLEIVLSLTQLDKTITIRELIQELRDFDKESYDETFDIMFHEPNKENDNYISVGEWKKGPFKINTPKLLRSAKNLFFRNNTNRKDSQLEK